VFGSLELPTSTETFGRMVVMLTDVMIAYFVANPEDVEVGQGRGRCLM
jgi:hypothetical protein